MGRSRLKRRVRRCSEQKQQCSGRRKSGRTISNSSSGSSSSVDSELERFKENYNRQYNNHNNNNNIRKKRDPLETPFEAFKGVLVPSKKGLNKSVKRNRLRRERTQALKSSYWKRQNNNNTVEKDSTKNKNKSKSKNQNQSKNKTKNKNKNRNKTKNNNMGNAPARHQEISKELQRSVLQNNCSAQKILENLKNGNYTNIVVMAGAGISVSCGIPDFRSPGTGLYDNLQKFNLPTPESVFELNYFKQTRGEAFYKLAKEMWPDNFQPSPTHLFIKLLEQKGYLKRCFTQNIDTLERLAGIPDDKIVEAHGSFAKSSCTECSQPYNQDSCKEKILAGDVPITCGHCGGLVKPEIVFFGEALPPKFGMCAATDSASADLLIIMGTSLTVQPFANLAEMVGPDCPRLLLNMKPVGIRTPDPSSNGLRLLQEENYRDCMIEGACDDSVRAICDVMGWRDELEDLVEAAKSKVGVNREPVDVSAAFPRMNPEGLAFNWKVSEERKKPLPAPKLAPCKPEEIEVDEMYKLAQDSEEDLAMILFEEETDLKRGGTIAGMLCLTGKAEEAWEQTDSVALVNVKNHSNLSMEAVRNAEILMEPMKKPGLEKTSFHQLVFHVPYDDDIEELFLWYIDTSNGKVSHQWGPFKIGGELAQNDQVSNHLEQDDLNEILKSLSELPAHLQGADESGTSEDTSQDASSSSSSAATSNEKQQEEEKSN